MSDPYTQVGIWVAGGVLWKLLGPTADYFGAASRNLAERTTENLQRILRTAWEKLGNSRDTAGMVNPRVAKAIWDDGPFVDDALAAEYFGGLLASARSEDGTDDSSLPFVHTLRSLSSDQIRLHYIVYAGFACGCLRSNSEFHDELLMFVPADLLESSFEDRHEDLAPALLLAVQGLIHMGLLAPSYAFHFDGMDQDAGLVREDTRTLDGVIIGPTNRGASLLLRAMNLRGHSPAVLANLNVEKMVTSMARPSLPSLEGIRIGSAGKLHVTRRSIADMSIEDLIADAKYDSESAIDELRDELHAVQAKVEELADET